MHLSQVCLRGTPRGQRPSRARQRYDPGCIETMAFQKGTETPSKWLMELLAVVWRLRTQPSRNTGVSPYFLVFSSKAVLPTNIAFRAPRVENYNEQNFDQARLVEVDSLEEEHLVTCVRMAKYLDGLRRYYNRNVNDRFFVLRDLVLRRK